MGRRRVGHRCGGNSAPAGPNSSWPAAAGGGCAGPAVRGGAEVRDGTAGGGDSAGGVGLTGGLALTGGFRLADGFGVDRAAAAAPRPLRPPGRSGSAAVRGAADGGDVTGVAVVADAGGAGGPRTVPGAALDAAEGARAGSTTEGGGSGARGARRGQASTRPRQPRTTAARTTFAQRIRCSSEFPAMDYH